MHLAAAETARAPLVPLQLHYCELTEMCDPSRSGIQVRSMTVWAKALHGLKTLLPYCCTAYKVISHALCQQGVN